MIPVDEVLSIYKESQIDDFLKKYTGLSLNEKNLSYEKIKKNYKFLGNSSSNGSNVGQLTSGEKGLVERITNAIDAVIEKQKNKCGIVSAKDSLAIIKKAFPKYYENMIDVTLKTPISPYYGHNFGVWVEEKYATCQTPGRKGHKHCSICDKDYDASNKEITDLVIPINPDGHELGALIAEIPATCKDTGVKEHRDCNLCGKHCDPITKKEIADLSIPTTNDHTFGGWIDEVAPTTTEFGTKGHKDCTVCGRHFDKDGKEITELRIAKIGTYNVVINGESEFYADGESVTVTAEDKESKIFKGWQDETGKIISTDKSYTFTVTGGMTLTAIYEDVLAVKKGLSSGQITGIVIGLVAVAGIGASSIFWFAVKKKSFADLGVALKNCFMTIGKFFKNLGVKIKSLFTKKK